MTSSNNPISDNSGRPSRWGLVWRGATALGRVVRRNWWLAVFATGLAGVVFVVLDITTDSLSSIVFVGLVIVASVIVAGQEDDAEISGVAVEPGDPHARHTFWWRIVGAVLSGVVLAFPLLVAALLLVFVGLPLFVFVKFLGRNKKYGPVAPGTPRGANSHHNANGSPKVRFDSRSEANEAARRLKEKSGDVMSAYRCSLCPDWHIGHSKR